MVGSPRWPRGDGSENEEGGALEEEELGRRRAKSDLRRGGVVDGKELVGERGGPQDAAVVEAELDALLLPSAPLLLPPPTPRFLARAQNSHSLAELHCGQRGPCPPRPMKIRIA